MDTNPVLTAQTLLTRGLAPFDDGPCEDILKERLEEVAAIEVIDDSFDYEYGSIRGTHQQVSLRAAVNRESLDAIGFFHWTVLPSNLSEAWPPQQMTVLVTVREEDTPGAEAETFYTARLERCDVLAVRVEVDGGSFVLYDCNAQYSIEADD